MTYFDHLLNAFEQASQADNPAKEGYAGMRRAVLAYVRELESYKQDAERYRWLREKHNGGSLRWFVYGVEYDRLDLDTAIDAACKDEW